MDINIIKAEKKHLNECMQKSELGRTYFSDKELYLICTKTGLRGI